MTQPLDFYHLDERLNDEQRQLRNQVRAFVQDEVLPKINAYWEAAQFPWEIIQSMKDLPIWGGTLTEHGCAGLDPLSVGLVRYELAKGDGSVGTFYGVHSGLAMTTIGLLGSEEQQHRWLPEMARLEKIGAFGLTEPLHGSDAASLATTAQRDGDHYVLNGEKRWIGNASLAHLLIIWARDDAGDLGGFVIENPLQTPGVSIHDLDGKIGKRAILNGVISLKNVQVPADNRLENVRSFRDMTRVLGIGRYSVAWEAAGIGAACYEMARDYALERRQFGRPIAGFQLIQHKLVEMASAVTLMQLACFRLAELMAAGPVEMGLLALAKYNNARQARIVAQLARETLGGNGLLIENHVARLMLDAEALYTYEGTNEINLLLVGRVLTGLSAFR